MSGAWQMHVFGVAMSSPTMSQSDTTVPQLQDKGARGFTRKVQSSICFISN